jgi:hypothetical protein
MYDKKVFILLKFLYLIFFSSTLSAQTFKVVDFDRLLRNHPIAGQYDKTSGSFKDTSSEIVPVEKLHKDLTQLHQTIEQLKKQKSELVYRNMVKIYDKENEEDIWEKIRKVDDAITKAQANEQMKQELLEKGGNPGIAGFEKVVNEIYRDVHKKYSEDGSKKTIILNRLPDFVYFPKKIKHNKNDLLRFFYSRSDKVLKSYLAHSYEVGMLLSSTSNPVLYTKKELDENEE